MQSKHSSAEKSKQSQSGSPSRHLFESHSIIKSLEKNMVEKDKLIGQLNILENNKSSRKRTGQATKMQGLPTKNLATKKASNLLSPKANEGFRSNTINQYFFAASKEVRRSRKGHSSQYNSNSLDPSRLYNVVRDFNPLNNKMNFTSPDHMVSDQKLPSGRQIQYDNQMISVDQNNSQCLEQ